MLLMWYESLFHMLNSLYTYFQGVENSVSESICSTQLAWRKLKSLKVTFPEILDAVATSDKKRFALLHVPSAEQPSEDPKAQATTTPSKVTDREDEGANDTEQSTTVLSAPPVTQAAAQENATQHALSVATSKEDTDPSHFLIRATQGHSIKSVDPASFLERLTLSDEPQQAQPSVPATASSTSLPDTVVHGTYHAAWPLILVSGGLKCMGRTHVHFATGPSLESVLAQNKGRGETEGDGKGLEGLDNGTVISGMRRDAQILIYIDIKKALAAGCPFWRSENGVILSEGMPIGEGKGGEGAKEGEKVVPLEFFDVVVERKAGLGVLWEHGKVVHELPQELAGRRNPKGRRVPPDDERGKGKK